MKSILFWMRANPWSVIAVGVALLSLAVLVWVFIATGGINTRIADRSEKLQEVRRLVRQQLQLPPVEVDGEPRELSGVYNEVAVARRKELRQQLESQRQRLFEQARTINREGHQQLTRNLFPSSPASQRFTTKRVYMQTFPYMLAAEDEAPQQVAGVDLSRLNLPTLDAGPPIARQTMQEAVEGVTDPTTIMAEQAGGGDFADLPGVDQMPWLSGNGSGDMPQLLTERPEPAQGETEQPTGPGSPFDRRRTTGQNQDGTSGDLTEQEYEQLMQRRRDALKRALRRNAETRGIYAWSGSALDTDSGQQDDSPYAQQQQTNAVPAFHVREFPSEETPTMVELWERQLELWIQQDLAEAIARTNADARSVLEAPVKRLIKMRVAPGYVGLHTAGLVRAVSSSGGSDSGSMWNRDQSGGSFGVGGENLPTAWRGAYPLPMHVEPGEPGQETPNNFMASPSGRVSNHVYDVRHALLDVVVDYQKLPRLMGNINKVNFMTVLKTQIDDVDEYEAMRNGYVYGAGDMVRVRMIIESAWLRSWTTPLMPEVTKQYLRVAEAPENYEGQGLPVAGSN